jgi:hypothetical protein
MGLFDDFFGKSQKRDLESGRAASDRALQQGYDDAAGIGRDYHQQATNYLQPYLDRSSRSGDMYETAIGAGPNGREGQQQFQDGYAGDPFRQANMDAATKTIRRQYNARGMDTSGNALLASARASQERGSVDWNAYLDRLKGLSDQQFAARTNSANLTSQFGNQLTGMRYGHGQARAGNETSFANAMAAGRNTGLNNLFGLGGLAMKAYAAGAGGPVPK